MKEKFFISMDKSKLDIPYIHKYLSEEAYWAKSRNLKLVEKSIENSICIGVYTMDNEQIGFARIVTDYVVFAWLMDVFIDDLYRGKGIGRMLLDFIFQHADLQKVNGIGLRTNDAHGLYEKYGFGKIESPDTWMLKKNN